MSREAARYDFRYKWSQQLLDLVVRYQFKKYRYAAHISLADLRSFLGLEEGEYRLYGNLKPKILDSLGEIEAKAGMRVELGERKAGRKVVGVVLRVAAQAVVGG